jgi:hypothetical protein
VVDGQVIDSNRVGSGEDYNVGNERNSDGYRVFSIEEIEEGTVSCEDATTALEHSDTGATAKREESENALNAAVAVLAEALSSLPDDSQLRSNDVCGKQVTSCKLRFPNQPLPFGGFPGANLTR